MTKAKKIYDKLDLVFKQFKKGDSETMVRTSVETMQKLKEILPTLKNLIDAVEGESKKKSLLVTYAAFEKKILNIKPESGTLIKQIKEAIKAGKKVTIEG
jgi:hypothetical protein